MHTLSFFAPPQLLFLHNREALQYARPSHISVRCSKYRGPWRRAMVECTACVGARRHSVRVLHELNES